MHNKERTDIKIISASKTMTIFARLCRSEVFHGRAAMFVVALWLFTNLFIR